MEVKKNRKADLERLKPGFIKLGVIIGLSITLIAFEWNTGIPDWTDIWTRSGEKFDDVYEPLAPKVEEKIVPPQIAMSEFIKIMDDKSVFIPPPIDFDWIDPDDNVPEWVPSGDLPLAPEDKIEIVVEEMPRFGDEGIDAFHRWVQARVRYPEEAAANNVMGTVYVGFVIEKDGSVSNIEIFKSPHNSLSEEVIGVIKRSPKWTPGFQLGNPARVRFAINVSFVLK